MTDGSGPVTTMEGAAQLAALQAMAGYCSKTFSVGGLLIGNDGTVIQQNHNRVIVDGALQDPTAHGERQLVDWYYAQIASGIALPEPSTISVVTSLDPCCMCTGAILTAGFNAVTVAEDVTSGINFDGSDTFLTLPSSLRPAAISTFAYPAITGSSCFEREARGSNLAFPAGAGTIDEKTAALCEVIFDDTLQTVRADVNNDVTPDKLIDILTLPAQNYIRVALQRCYADALTVAFQQYQPDVRLADALFVPMKMDRMAGGPGDAVALIDYFGNLLLVTSGNANASAIQTAFMACTRSYAGLRHMLFLLHASDPNLYPEDPHLYLAHPKYCTFVAVLGPDYSSESFMGLGAYGSTMEGPLPASNPNQYQYCVPRISPDEVVTMCEGMPPLYSQIIKVNPVPVGSPELAEAVRLLWEQL